MLDSRHCSSASVQTGGSCSDHFLSMGPKISLNFHPEALPTWHVAHPTGTPAACLCGFDPVPNKWSVDSSVPLFALTLLPSHTSASGLSQLLTFALMHRCAKCACGCTCAGRRKFIIPKPLTGQNVTSPLRSGLIAIHAGTFQCSHFTTVN